MGLFFLIIWPQGPIFSKRKPFIPFATSFFFWVAQMEFFFQKKIIVSNSLIVEKLKKLPIKTHNYSKAHGSRIRSIGSDLFSTCVCGNDRNLLAWHDAQVWTHTVQPKQGVCHTVALPFTLKSTLRQKKNYGNSKNISPCKNIIFKKSSKRNQNPSTYYNSLTNLKFQHKPKYHLSRILK